MTSTAADSLADANGGRVASLDGLRAVSILLVVIGHASQTMPWVCAHESLSRFVLAGARLGVSIFFVISGFIITTLLVREAGRSGSISLRRFYVRRALRILPPFYVFLLAVAIVSAAGVSLVGPRELLVSGLFLWNYLGDGTWWLGHTWSLAVEEQFYLLWPAVLALCGGRRATWFAAALIAACPFIRVGCYALAPRHREAIEFWFHTRMDSLMFGCLLALVRPAPRFQRLAARFQSGGGPMLAVLFLFVASPLLGSRFRLTYHVPVRWTLEGLAIALVMHWLVANPESVAGRVLNWRPMVHIGLISFSLYLWQQLFLTAANTTVFGRPPLNVLCAFAMAEASYWCVETPFRRVKERMREAREARI